nr:hypothetical protein Iba_chr11fCG13380 [Ipomoea batatas]
MKIWLLGLEVQHPFVHAYMPHRCSPAPWQPIWAANVKLVFKDES